MNCFTWTVPGIRERLHHKSECTHCEMWGDCGKAKWIGIILESFQLDAVDLSLGTSGLRRVHRTVHNLLGQRNQRQLVASQGAMDMISFYSETKLPLTPVVEFYPWAKDNPAVTLTLQLWCGYGKSTYSQSNFHSLSIWPMHWALIWVNESFSCRTSKENVHSLCLRGGRCLQ